MAYYDNIERSTITNRYYRREVYCDDRIQIFEMNILPLQEIGNEVHPHTTQFFRIESGHGLAILEGDTDKILTDGIALVVPAGTYHNIINTSKKESLKLYTIYSPPNHPPGTMQKTKPKSE
jgi:mannose-6-phosphate isomerase-like protein (cupin superfamily)